METRHDNATFLFELISPSSVELHARHIRVIDVLEAVAGFERSVLEEPPERLGCDTFEELSCKVRAIREAFLGMITDSAEYVSPDFDILDEKERAFLFTAATIIKDPVFESFIDHHKDMLLELAETSEHLLLVDEDNECFNWAIDEVHNTGSRLRDALPEWSDIPEKQRAKTEIALLAYAIRRLAAICENDGNVIAVQDLIIRLQSLGL